MPAVSPRLHARAAYASVTRNRLRDFNRLRAGASNRYRSFGAARTRTCGENVTGPYFIARARAASHGSCAKLFSRGPKRLSSPSDNYYNYYPGLYVFTQI